MPRSKNPAVVQESIGPRQQAFSSNILTDEQNLKTEYDFLNLLRIKREMGIISPSDYDALLSSASGSAYEKASIAILRNLNRYSEFDPRLERIFRLVGSNNKYVVARRLAQRMVDSAATKRVLAETIGVRQNQLPSFGSTFVAEDIGRSQVQLEQNPMASVRQSAVDMDAYRDSLINA